MTFRTGGVQPHCFLTDELSWGERNISTHAFMQDRVRSSYRLAGLRGGTGRCTPFKGPAPENVNKITQELTLT